MLLRKRTRGTYIFLFHESKTDTVDNMLSNLDVTVDAFGAWDGSDIHFRYMAALLINIVVRVAKSTRLPFGKTTCSFQIKWHPSGNRYSRTPIQHK
jgi:hypothetical protein